MTLSAEAQEIYARIADGGKLGDIKKLAKVIKRNHDVAMELWSTGEYFPRLLAVLIVDKKLLTQELLERLAGDMHIHSEDQRSQLADWLLANQLMKGKETVGLMESWEHHASTTLRRIFWTYQGRRRWNGKAPPDNTAALLQSLEARMADAEPDVQWAMNFAAAQIGIHEPVYRSRCIELGKRLVLYRDYPVPRGCTTPYLPEWIKTEVAKLGG